MAKTFNYGFNMTITARRIGSWTQYEATQTDVPGGYIVNNRVFRSGLKREALEKIAEWKAQDILAEMKAESGIVAALPLDDPKVLHNTLKTILGE
jgi:hypothetical protein